MGKFFDAKTRKSVKKDIKFIADCLFPSDDQKIEKARGNKKPKARRAGA